MKLTKEQKLDAYIYALHCCYAEHSSADRVYGYMCLDIKEYCQRQLYLGWIEDDEMEILFPEFIKQKPRRTATSKEWWPSHDMDSRIKAITKAIALL